MYRALLAIGFAVLMLAGLARAESASDLCLYTAASGKLVQVNGLEAVPEAYRTSARCFSSVPRSPEPPSGVEGQGALKEFKPLAVPPKSPAGQPAPALAAPEDISLQGSTRKVAMNSALGPIELRWPRSVERLFGRTPERAMADAALTASRALKQKAFPPRVKNLRLNWQVVFMDEEPPAGQVPAYLRANCHPGWMTPPANVYVVAQRVTGHCSGRAATSTVADAELVELLVHEIGHAVEYYLLSTPLPNESMRAEGFATWFEAFASDYSGLIPRGSVMNRHRSQALAEMRARPGPWRFSYSGEDYSRASMYFHGIEERFGVPDLLRIYERISKRREPFLVAAQAELVMKPVELESLAAKAAGS